MGRRVFITTTLATSWESPNFQGRSSRIAACAGVGAGVTLPPSHRALSDDDYFEENLTCLP